jgi:hypothetical protein
MAPPVGEGTEIIFSAASTRGENMNELATRRIAAFVIDTLLMGFLCTRLVDWGWVPRALPMWWPAALQVLLMGGMNGVLGYSPGKLALRLRVRRSTTRLQPGIEVGVLREAVKVLLVWSTLGIFWGLRDVITTRHTRYDMWLGVEVIDHR